MFVQVEVNKSNDDDNTGDNFEKISAETLSGVSNLNLEQNKEFDPLGQEQVRGNNSYILAAGLYQYLASTLEYLNHIYQKKLEECCILSTLKRLEISDPSKEQNTILKVARQQFFIIHGEFSPTS